MPGNMSHYLLESTHRPLREVPFTCHFAFYILRNQGSESIQRSPKPDFNPGLSDFIAWALTHWGYCWNHHSTPFCFFPLASVVAVIFHLVISLAASYNYRDQRTMAYVSPTSCVNKAYWNSTTHYLWLQWQSWIVVTETTWPAKLQIFTIWPWREEIILQPLMQ